MAVKKTIDQHCAHYEFSIRTSGIGILKQNILKRVIFGILICLLTIHVVSAQIITDKTLLNLGQKGEQLSPAWSSSGRYLAYQSTQNGNWNIYVYDFVTHKIIQVTHSLSDDEHPVWIHGKDALVFDSKKNDRWHIYYLNLKTGREKLLFHIPIQSHEASFSPTGRLIAFSGFDPSTSHWQVFTYDLVYNNLNLITKVQGDVSFPVFSPDGRYLAYQLHNFQGKNLIALTNWAGNINKVLCRGLGRASWTPDSWRLVFIPERGSESFASVGQDGSGYEQIGNSQVSVCCPAVSPDGKKIAYSIMTDTGWKIVVAAISL